MNDFLTFKNRYFITANLVMEKPIHIGRGITLKPVGTDLPVIKDQDEKPYIPGSSLKGVLRTNFEKLIRTLGQKGLKVDGEELWACDIFDEKRKDPLKENRTCINNKRKEELENESREDNKINEAKFTEKVWRETCIACRLFGSQLVGSRIYVKDASISNAAELFRLSEIRDGVGIDRDTGTASPKAKFDYEIVPSGAQFKIEMILENIELWEVGFLLTTLKLWERAEVAIGGMTSRGLGWGRLEKIVVEKVEVDKLVDYLIEGKKEPVAVDTLINYFKSKLGGKKDA